jgi:hypothetical protein
MYSVFQADGSARRNRIGLAGFVRTLRAARLYSRPGDLIIGWSNSGNPRSQYICGDDWKVRKA